MPRLNLVLLTAIACLIAALASLRERTLSAAPLTWESPPPVTSVAFAPPPASAPVQPNTLEIEKLPVVITPSGRSDQHEATARRRLDGHFAFDTAVNGVHLQMLFDTGASSVNLRAEDAARLGFDVNNLVYSATATTANGVAETAPVTLATLTVGGITRRNVQAFVARPGKLDVNLLGQSFLSRIAGFRVEGDELVLKGGG